MEKHNPYSTCQFPVDKSDSEQSIRINNFVYEPFPFEDETFIYEQTFILFFLITGSASFSTDYQTYDLKKGDVFFVFPKKRYKRHDFKNAKFIYISFSVGESKSILESIGIEYTNPCRYGLEKQIKFARKEFNRSKENNAPELIPKGLLYYLLSFFGTTNYETDNKHKENVMNEVLKYIDTNYSEKITLISLSRQFYISYNYLSIMFKQTYGVNFSKYLENVRMMKAKQLLKDKNKNITDVCFSVGYNDIRYFDRVFKNFSGMTPKEYRKSINQ